MNTNRGKRPLAFWLLMLLLLFQGLSATPSGLILVLDPTGGWMQMPLSMLEGTPFSTYLVPGLILSIVLGLGAFFVLGCLVFLPDWSWVERLNPFKSQHWARTASAAFGLALVALGLRITHAIGWFRAILIGLLSAAVFFVMFLAFMR